MYIITKRVSRGGQIWFFFEGRSNLVSRIGMHNRLYARVSINKSFVGEVHNRYRNQFIGAVDTTILQ
jgi:hypothetical protein